MSKTIQVAIAVIHYQQQYLLGFRTEKQHQGNRYEFIGGKIESHESPKQALIREVYEEIGCDVTDQSFIKMGVIHHNYIDKQVLLHIFKIELNFLQYQNLQKSTGQEGQKIYWVDFNDLIANHYQLPDANQRILDWLTMPSIIAISQDLNHFPNMSSWLEYYVKNLTNFDYFYPRLNCSWSDYQTAIDAICQHNRHLHLIINDQYWQQISNFCDQHILHLNHQQLMSYHPNELPKNLRYFASCHDMNSINKINLLAKTHQVMGCFLSPVFATPTHSQQQGMGWQPFANMAACSHVPIYALGGMQLSMLNLAREHQGFGIAGIRLVDS